jgi:hypothetical protein
MAPIYRRYNSGRFSFAVILDFLRLVEQSCISDM